MLGFMGRLGSEGFKSGGWGGQSSWGRRGWRSLGQGVDLGSGRLERGGVGSGGLGLRKLIGIRGVGVESEGFGLGGE